MKRFAWVLSLCVLFAGCPYAMGQTPELAARYVSVAPVIDGALDEACWDAGLWSGQFVDLVDGAPGWLDSRCAVLWDDEALYIAFRFAEPNVTAHMTARDAPIYRENDAELFIAGPDAYYEFEINARGTIYEVLWVWNDAYEPHGRHAALDPAGRTMRLTGIGDHVHPRGLRIGFLEWDWPGLTAAVAVDGTLNDASDTDRGWTVEVRAPWAGMAAIMPDSAPTPREGDTLRVDCSRFQHVDADGRTLSPPAGWALRAHGEYDSHMPGRFARVRLVRQ